MTHRIPWTPPDHPSLETLNASHVVALSTAEPWGHLVAIARCAADTALHMRDLKSPDDEPPGASCSPVVYERDDEVTVCDDPVAIARTLRPDWFRDGTDERLLMVRDRLIDAVYSLGHMTDQAEYEAAHDRIAATVRGFDDRLARQRFLGGDSPDASDVLLFTFSIRLDPVFYELFKASIGLLADFPHLEAHARDLFERQPFWSTTDFDQIKRYHYLHEPVTNAKGIVPSGGIPDLDAPHGRANLSSARTNADAVQEDQSKQRGAGEWVRPASEERSWVRADGSGDYDVEPGRYHVYAPYNCPWSHRALLGRSILGLEDAVGASIVYFRRDPERGWQFNPDIPGCTADLANGLHYIQELYESVGSSERSVPILWDTKTDTIVSNESADILRMFSTEFSSLRTTGLDLYPEEFRAEIDRLNAEVYQRINNGAYKAGFAGSQPAYERAFARYFRALKWLDDLLDDREWLAGSPAPTEADLRLFPTLFRHDAVYFSRFKLNEARLEAYPRLSDWLNRMLAVPGIAEASNLDHSRNGYFGRTGNEIVPAGPSPLGLSPKDFPEDVWLNRNSPD